jgi:hypothetical protein
MPGSSNERLGPENKAHMTACTQQPKVYWNEKIVKFLNNASSDFQPTPESTSK